jgi:hypothetical protein
MEAVEVGYRRMGCQDYDDAMAMIRQAADQLEEFLEVAGSREKMEALVLEADEPTPIELMGITAVLENLPYLFRKMLPEAAKEMPHDPGGRPPALTEEGAREACKEVGELTGRGATLLAAQKRVAMRRGVSLRTVQRAWQKRLDET